LTTRLSVLITRLVPSTAVWYLTSTMGEPYMWSFSRSGRELRKSYRRTIPSWSPAARCMPVGSCFSAVTP